MSEIVGTMDNFEKEVLQSPVPVLVDFWATWCGPCRMIAPAVAQMSEKYQGKLAVVKVDVDQNTDLASQYGVASIPTLMIFKGGEIVDQKVGAVSVAVLDSFVSQHLQG
ncbi:MAG: thioredoxin [Sphaerochaeta sp.]|jgi:thioredoxin 1|nr:thioredoxin [Sphaerochaeta sp.]MCH3920182.1 thioredoxin [Sphaerochaeta sp.]MCI2045383.1 thioredoxin [Sphaerochaeta sp.]MCI2076778.1 thioredoxin [Sphaerochaeta sp.]MCI2096784.1 thioredoxin [Sphaerochaeta sp.]